MSRTDKTKPYRVKLRDGDLAWVESHDHRFGPCTMPDLKSAEAFGMGTPCRREFHYTGTKACCCSWCRPSAGEHTRPAKKSRMSARAECRRALGER